MIKDVYEVAEKIDAVGKIEKGMGVLFPYVGLKKIAIESYVDEIRKSNLDPETKAYCIMNTRQTLKRRNRQEQIARKAIEIAKPGTDFSRHSGIREEWLERFMDSAAYVSDEEVQDIWAKILAKEFEKPGYSPSNLIRILSELTPYIAKKFGILCSLMGYLIGVNEEGTLYDPDKCLLLPLPPYPVELLKKLELSYSDFNELEAIGLIKIDTLVYHRIFSQNGNAIIKYGDEIKEYKVNSKKLFPYSNIVFTDSGRALSEIVDSESRVDYMEMLNATLLQHGVKCIFDSTVSLHEVEVCLANMIEHE